MDWKVQNELSDNFLDWPLITPLPVLFSIMEADINVGRCILITVHCT